MPERACKAGALPAELHAPRNHMILMIIVMESRENDYLLSEQAAISELCRALGEEAGIDGGFLLQR